MGLYMAILALLVLTIGCIIVFKHYSTDAIDAIKFLNLHICSKPSYLFQLKLDRSTNN